MSFSLWADAEEHEVILPHFPEDMHNLSEIRYLYIRHKSGCCINASGPSGEVKFEGKDDPDAELQRLHLEFVENFSCTELRDSLETLTRDPYPD